MLARPTTDQVLDGIVASLTDDVLPAIDDEPARVAVQMMQQILRGAAVRAAHEIAWMHEEGEAMLAYARRVADGPLGTPAVTTALATVEAGAREGRHLDEACAAYDAAGRCLEEAIEAALAGAGGEHGELADELHRDGRALLEQRLAHENQIMGEWAFVGRS
jgi:hypothetical protein